jgi:putative PIN family toxin of toxin-antitoxin system
MHAVIDTSAWVSAVLSRGGRAAGLIEAFKAGRFTLLTSEPLRAETEEVLGRPELIVTGLARMTARELLATIRERAEIVPITGSLALCRDPKDDMVIETAARGRAGVLVSNDKDLTDDPIVVEYLARAGVRVLTVVQFLDEIERTGEGV